jgi:hypothetical protein
VLVAAFQQQGQRVHAVACQELGPRAGVRQDAMPNGAERGQ